MTPYIARTSEDPDIGGPDNPRASDGIGLRPITGTSSDLRHTSATLALLAGVHPKVVSERMGHANVGITLDIYSHVVKGMQEDAAVKVAELLFG